MNAEAENRIAPSNDLAKPAFLASAGLFIGTIFFFLPSLSGEFVTLDDYQYVIDNPLVLKPGWESTSRFVSEVKSPSTVSGYYQPMTMISLMIDAAITGRDGFSPFGFKLTSILLHGLNTVLVMLVMRRLVGGMLVPVIIAAVFALHPAQVESVSWISQRKTVLSAAFGLGCLLCYLRSVSAGRRGPWLAGSLVFYLFGALSKPTIVLLPLTFVLLDHWPLRRPIRTALLEKLPFAVMMIVTGSIAWLSQAGSGAGLSTATITAGDGTFKWDVGWNLGLYLGTVFWPTTLSPYRPLPPPFTFASLTVIASIVFLTIAVGSFRRVRPFFVGAGAFVLLLAPTLGGVQFAATTVADRFLYLPLMFLLIPIAALLQHLVRKRSKFAQIGQIAAIGVVIALGRVSLAQQEVWQNSLTLWLHVQKIMPQLPKANYELAVIFHDHENFDMCDRYATTAWELEPHNAHYAHMLGRARTRIGQPESGLAIIKQAIELGLGGKQALGHVSLAQAYLALEKREKANEALKLAFDGIGVEALMRAIRFLEIYANRPDWALDYYRLALKKTPNDYTIRFQYAGALAGCGQKREALAEYDRVIQMLDRNRELIPLVESSAAEVRAKLRQEENSP